MAQPHGAGTQLPWKARPHRTLKRKVPYRQHPSWTQSADARAAWVPPMWPPTVSGPQWGGCSLLCSSWTHAEPLHKAGKKDKREHRLITAAKPNKQIMTSTQSGWSKIWSYIKKSYGGSRQPLMLYSTGTPKTFCSYRRSVSHQFGWLKKKYGSCYTQYINPAILQSIHTIAKKLYDILIAASIMKLNNSLIKCLSSGFRTSW